MSKLLPKINIAANDQYAKLLLGADLKNYSQEEMKALHYLAQLAPLMDSMFLRQSHPDNERWLSELKEEKIEDRDEKLHFFDINMGAFDRLADESGKPHGANFYPSDMTKGEFDEWVKSLNPEKAEQAKGFYTMIRRDQKGALVAVPYNEFFSKECRRASELLSTAADILEKCKGYDNFVTFLRSRAKAFLSNDYAPSDVDWLRVKGDSKIELTVGPYEVYEDELMNLKAAFEVFLGVQDVKGSEKLKMFASTLQECENILPCSEKFKNKNVKQGKPIIAINLIALGGDRGGPKTIAYNLPNDTKVTDEHGSKMVILSNVQQAKFVKILLPISEFCIHKSQRNLVTFEAFSTHTLCHEMSHSLGPHLLDEKLYGHANVRLALGPQHSALEEGKADIVGLYLLHYFATTGRLPKQNLNSYWVTFLAGIFRSIRFGIREAHGRGLAIILNFIMDQGGYKLMDDGTYMVIFENILSAVSKTCKTILEIQGTGDKAAAEALCNKYAVNRPATQQILQLIENSKLPVDIAPVFRTI